MSKVVTTVSLLIDHESGRWDPELPLRERATSAGSGHWSERRPKMVKIAEIALRNVVAFLKEFQGPSMNEMRERLQPEPTKYVTRGNGLQYRIVANFEDQRGGDAPVAVIVPVTREGRLEYSCDCTEVGCCIHVVLAVRRWALGVRALAHETPRREWAQPPRRYWRGASNPTFYR